MRHKVLDLVTSKVGHVGDVAGEQHGEMPGLARGVVHRDADLLNEHPMKIAFEAVNNDCECSRFNEKEGRKEGGGERAWVEEEGTGTWGLYSRLKRSFTGPSS